MTTWSQLFAGSLPAPTPPDLGKALMVRTGPAWVPDFIRSDDVTGPWHVAQVINLSGGAARASGVQPALQIAGGAAGAGRSIDMTSFTAPVIYQGYRANGTPAAPSAVKIYDDLTVISTGGYGATAWSGSRALIHMAASEDWTDTAQGSTIFFRTTPKGANAAVQTWQIQDIGTFSPLKPLDIGSPAQPTGDIFSSKRVFNGTGAFWNNPTGALRWGAYVYPADTGSGNGGSDFYLTPWADNGSIMPQVMIISRATGEVIFAQGVTSNIAVRVDAAAGLERMFVARTNGIARWRFGADGSPESGSNAGSNFLINRISDAGAQLGTALTINRATGAAAFAYSGSFGGALSVATSLTVGGSTFITGALFATTNININGPPSAERTLGWSSNNSTRWYMGVTGGTEPGGSVGSDWFLAACNDSGAYVGSGIRITRSNLYSYFYAPMTVTTPAGGVGNVQLYPGVSTNSGYIQFNAADSSQAGYIGWALASSKTIYLQTANGYKYQFAGAMPVGPDNTNLGYARKLPRFYTVPSWVEYLANDTIQIAQAGCTYFVVTTVATQPEMFQGFHCKLANMTGASMQIVQNPGASLYWVNPAGTLQSGTRNFAWGGFAEVLLVDNVTWILSGTGIS